MLIDYFHWIIIRGLIDTDSNNWFSTNQLVCDHVFSCTWEQKDINICRLQGFFFSACSVQPLLSAVTQPETARCRRSQTQPEQSMYAQSPERKPLHERKQNPLLQRPSAACHAAFLTPASQVSLGTWGRTLPNDPRRACNSSLSWIEKYTDPIDLIDHIMMKPRVLWSRSPQFTSSCQCLRSYMTSILMIQQVSLWEEQQNQKRSTWGSQNCHHKDRHRESLYLYLLMIKKNMNTHKHTQWDTQDQVLCLLNAALQRYCWEWVVSQMMPHCGHHLPNSIFVQNNRITVPRIVLWPRVPYSSTYSLTFWVTAVVLSYLGSRCGVRY